MEQRNFIVKITVFCLEEKFLQHCLVSLSKISIDIYSSDKSYKSQGVFVRNKNIAIKKNKHNRHLFTTYCPY